MSPTLLVHEDADSVARRAAGLVLRASMRAADERGEFGLVLSGDEYGPLRVFAFNRFDFSTEYLWLSPLLLTE